MKRTAVWKIAIFILAAALIGLTSAILDTHGTSDEIRGLRVSTKGGEAGDLAQWSRYRKVFEGLNLAWARLPLAWSKIETSPGTYDWSSQEYNLAKNAIQSARGMGAEVVLTIKSAPDFFVDPDYTAGPGGTPLPWPKLCGRITPQGIQGLASFVNALLERLSVDLGTRSPESIPVGYIELWNEPDVAADQVLSPSNFGCWQRGFAKDLAAAVDPGSEIYSEAYEAGSYYAQVINFVSPAVKAQYPNIKFVAGAAASTSSGFLAAVVDQAVENFDVLSYHQYTSSTNHACDIAGLTAINEKTFLEVRNYLDTHSGKDKSILISEGALRYEAPDQTAALSSTQTPAPEFFDCQAQYASSLLDWTQQKAAQGKLLGFIWYTIGTNGWAETDLLFPNKTPKPVYSAWKR